MQNLNWPYPAWYLIFCLLAGIAAAILLYRRENAFRDQPAALRYGMAFLRGLVVTLLSSLLLAPMLKLIQSRSEPPVIILAQDLSESVGAALAQSDSSAYMRSLDEMASKLEASFTVHRIGFGEKLSTDNPAWIFDGKATDMGQFMQYVGDFYKGQNVGAVIVATDGSINRGRNPLYVDAALKAPLSIIALGDTTRKTDLQIRNVFHNSIAYAGDKFVVQVDLSAVNLQGISPTLEVRSIRDNQQTLLERIPLQVESNSWFQTRDIIIEATSSGIQRYRLQLSHADNEVTYSNNVRDFFVEVIDGRLNVLVLADSPHPDLRVWRSALISQRNYAVDVVMAQDFTSADLKQYDLVILHQLPSARWPISALLDDMQKLEMPKIMVTGMQTDLAAFNRSQQVLQIDYAANRTPNEVTMVVNPAFSLFKLSDELKTKIETFSPLISPYGEYTTRPSATVLGYQRIGRVDTQYPLIITGESGDVRTCVMAGEGIWKWQLFDQVQNGSTAITNELLGQLVQYASTKSDKRKFRVIMPKNLFTELEEISFRAELYNDNYEPVNTSEVTMQIRNEQGQEFLYTFNPQESAYSLNAGRFAEGSYVYTATTDLNGVRHTHEGRFVVQPVQLESMTVEADHGLLRQLATKYGGEVVYPDQMMNLTDRILADDTIKPVLYSTTHTRPLINLKWLCFILLGTLTLEWFLRRYFGGY